MKTNIALIAALVSLFAATTFAQTSNEGITMVCRTTDGMVTISERSVQLADYQLRFDSFVTDGVVRFTDPERNTVAVLDARADDGLYLEINENGTTMQVVAARAEIRYRFDGNGNEPSAPAWSAVVGMFTSRPAAEKR